MADMPARPGNRYTTDRFEFEAVTWVMGCMLREQAGVRVPTVLRRRILYNKPHMLRVQLEG
jgi:hypothetical protein